MHSRRCSIPWLLVALLGAGCAPQTSEQATLESEFIVLALMDAWQNADVDVVYELFWPEATYDDFQSQQTYDGIDEIAGYVMSIHEWADDVYWNVGRVHASPTVAVAEWVFSAVQARPIGDQVPVATGREVLLNGVTIVELEGNRIVRAADYIDTTPMMLQLGGRLEMPGGAVLDLDAGN